MWMIVGINRRPRGCAVRGCAARAVAGGVAVPGRAPDRAERRRAHLGEVLDMRDAGHGVRRRRCDRQRGPPPPVSRPSRGGLAARRTTLAIRSYRRAARCRCSPASLGCGLCDRGDRLHGVRAGFGGSPDRARAAPRRRQPVAVRGTAVLSHPHRPRRGRRAGDGHLSTASAPRGVSPTRTDALRSIAAASTVWASVPVQPGQVTCRANPDRRRPRRPVSQPAGSDRETQA